jgi:hypothetical protein
MLLFILCYYAEYYISYCYAECHFAERRGANILSIVFPELTLSE